MNWLRHLHRHGAIACGADGLGSAGSSAPALEAFRLSGVYLEHGTLGDEPVFKMAMPREAIQDPMKEQLADRNFMAWLPIDFGDGEVEVDLASELVDDAPDYARGFIGLTFRIDDAGRFESIYLRPTNSSADDQVRRNHTVQYVAYPDYRFYRLLAESPEKCETYAELDLGRWIHMRIVVAGQRAELTSTTASGPS